MKSNCPKKNLPGFDWDFFSSEDLFEFLFEVILAILFP